MIPGVRYHHEKIDGTGYPNAMKGEKVPLFARVIAVVDSFDAMTNARPYRNALGEDRAIKELKDFSGTQFDSHLVKNFLEILPIIKETEKEDAGEVVISRLIKAA
jgi:HD-GYP domain-containing protein (c-di-GMP phosphodiesterase class II)